MSRKQKVRPVAADVISDIVSKMAEECATTYKVADNAEIDWCPCCGVNIRLALALFDATGDEERAESIIRAHREIKP
jgi:hypothetical protein